MLDFVRAYSVHVFTASGGALALFALFSATGEAWDLMFYFLGAALVVDGVDGTIARRLHVAERLPRWSGDVLDLVVDYTTYVFVPAFAIAIGGFMPFPYSVIAGSLVGITGALYFADREMKTEDNYFRGFPTLWNAAAFYLFLLRPPPWLAAVLVVALAASSFAPFKFVHPFRVVRLRAVTLTLVVVWCVLAAVAIAKNFEPGLWITGALVAIAAYFVGVGMTDRGPLAMLDLLFDPNAWAALVTLTALEIVLGIDNLVFISVLTSRLDKARARRARAVGLSLAFVFRIAMLAAMTWMMGLRDPIFTLFGMGISGRDIILIGGGVFLIGKATHEIHNEVEAREGENTASADPGRAFALVIMQLVAIDLVFSIDSIITAIGMVEQIEVMVAAVCIAMLVMYFAAASVGAFIKEHPTTKMLALAFLVLIGVALVADGFDVHIPRGYIYFAMAFAGAVEFFNVLAGRRRHGGRKP